MIKLSITCNDCGAIGASGKAEKPHLMRAKLKTRGWQTSLPKGKDRCPHCVKISNVEKEPNDSPGPEEVNSNQCDSPCCPGWMLTEDEHRVERCDTCKRFKDDEEAARHVMSLEGIDWNRHKNARTQELLSQTKEALLCFLNDSQDMPATLETARFISRVEGLLGRTVWLEESYNG